MTIEAHTKYTKKSYREFQWFYMVKGGVRKVISITFMVSLFTMGVISLAYNISRGIDLSTVYAITVIPIFIPVFCILLPRTSTYFAYKNSPAMFDMGISYTFQEDCFTVVTSGMISGTSNIRYEALFSVYQTKGYFYINLQKQQAYMVDKASFVMGTPEDLERLFEKVIPRKKYHSYSR